MRWILTRNHSNESNNDPPISFPLLEGKEEGQKDRSKRPILDDGNRQWRNVVHINPPILVQSAKTMDKRATNGATRDNVSSNLPDTISYRSNNNKKKKKNVGGDGEMNSEPKGSKKQKKFTSPTTKTKTPQPTTSINDRNLNSKKKKDNRVMSNEEGAKETAKCDKCSVTKPRLSFTAVQWQKPNRQKIQCNSCSSKKKKIQMIKPAFIKERLVARKTKLPPNQKERQYFQITWSSSSLSSSTSDSRSNPPLSITSCSVISESDESYIKLRIIKKGDYAKLSTSDSERILQDTSMTMSQIISLRSALLQQKTMFRHQALQRDKRKVYKLYEEGENVVDLSKKKDYPPMSLFRTILAEKGYSRNQIKKCFGDPKRHFNEREQIEYINARAADCAMPDTKTDQLIKSYATVFEDIVGEWLTGRGIAFVQEEQLAKEQQQEFGKPILTPDFLLLDDLKINGESVSWIDCKAYYGANIPFNIKKMKKQMNRYIDHWGDGAILYLMGYNETLSSKVGDGCTFWNAHDGEFDRDRILQLENQILEAFNK